MTSIAEVLKGWPRFRQDWHGAGCLEMPNLEGMARHASARKIRRSVETGTGKSTLLLSHLSEHHLCFSLDDARSLNDTPQPAAGGVQLAAESPAWWSSWWARRSRR
jgi:hypothetical protein